MASDECTPVLNVTRLQDSAGGDSELIRELVELYLDDTQARIPELLEAAGADELEQMGRVAHGLKGASLSMGCEEAAAAFLALETRGREGDASDIDAVLEQAQAAWRRACERLQELAA